MSTEAATSTVGKVRRLLGSYRALKSGYYLYVELQRAFFETHAVQHDRFEDVYRHKKDPWSYAGAYHIERYAIALELLTLAQTSAAINNAIEIGCAEGLFTQMLADRGFALTAIDFSETALERARERCGGSTGNIVFYTCDILGKSQIPGPAEGFDLVIAMDVLESYSRRSDLARARRQMLDLLKPNGFLLVTSTAQNAVVEEAFWSRWIIRGRTVNKFIGKDPTLNVWKDIRSTTHQCTLYRKRGSR
jgi:2-polyprenyl-3-methyl-5-hydroxy-6-metoxy-1,4-benzoquinol methylase